MKRNIDEQIRLEADQLLEAPPTSGAEEVQVPYIGKDKKQRMVPFVRRKPIPPKACGLIKMGE